MNQMKLHHLAVVVADIKRSAEFYKKLRNITPVTKIIYDAGQKVHIQFLAGPVLGNLQLELLAPDSDDSPVASALKKGGGPTHLCVEVSDRDQARELARRHGSPKNSAPIKAPALANCKIAFVFTPDQQIVEFVQGSAEAGENS